MKLRLVESVDAGSLTRSGNLFRTQLISEGVGSSGIYHGDVLERDMATALPSGTKVYFDHMGDDERDRGRARSVENLVGVFEGDPFYEDGASFTNIRFYENTPRFGNAAAFMTEAMNDLGVSIEIYDGEKDDEGNITALGYSPHNSLAVVTTAGARGRVLALAESFRTHEGSEVKKEEGGGSMLTQEDVASITAPILAAIEAIRPVEDDITEDKGPKLADVVEAITAADLTPLGREAVYDSIGHGVELTEAIATEKKREDSIREALTESVSEGLRKQSSSSDWSSKADALYGGK